MTIFLEEPRTPGHVTFAGGIATLGDIASAAWDSMHYVENTNASYVALSEAIERRRREIHAATGVELPNPLLDADNEWYEQQYALPGTPAFVREQQDKRRETREEIIDRHLAQFGQTLTDLAEKFPAARDVIAPDRDLWTDATEIAKQSDQKLSTLMASRGGLGKWGAMLVGGMGGALNDPLTIMSLGIGAGPGMARTVAGRILAVGGKEAIINAATEAAAQPTVQAWRARVGLEHGIEQAIENVIMGGLIGGSFGAAGGLVGEAAARVGDRMTAQRRMQRSAPPDQRIETPSPEVDQSLPPQPGRATQDALEPQLPPAAAKTIELPQEIRQKLPPDLRGAIDVAETLRTADEMRPPSASPEAHDRALARADMAVRMPDMIEAWPGFEPDPAKIQRIVREIAGETSDPTNDKPKTPLIDFLIGRGGLAEYKGELAAIGADRISKPFLGRLVRKDGDSLDYAREAAAEAGFFDHLYGTADEAVAKSSVRDLLDAIEEEARIHLGGMRSSAEEAALDRLEGIVTDIARLAGPNVDDGLIARAARLAIEDGYEPFDALERVLVIDEKNVAYVKGFRDTRGDDQQYHGAPQPIDAFWEGHYNTFNYYGQGFYTTDAVDIANGYANRRGAPQPTLYRVDELVEVKFFDMEQPPPDWMTNPSNFHDIYSDLIEAAREDQPATTREYYDALRNWSRSYDLPADEVQDLFDTIRYQLEQRGYGGLEHKGGILTDNLPHRVRIYWNPNEQVKITQIDPAQYRVNAGERTGDPLPGWSDEELLRISEERGSFPEPDGIDDPARLNPDDIDISELQVLPDDFMLPTEDGLITAAQMRDQLARMDNMISLVEACRI